MQKKISKLKSEQEGFIKTYISLQDWLEENKCIESDHRSNINNRLDELGQKILGIDIEIERLKIAKES